MSVILENAEKALEMYKSGQVVETRNIDLSKHISLARDILGISVSGISRVFNWFSERPRLIVYSDKDKDSQKITCFAGVNYNKGLFIMPEFCHEAVILHECAHYVLGKERLCFGELTSERGWYDRLVSETLAESVAAIKYGYNDDLAFSNLDMSRSLRGRELFRHLNLMGGSAVPQLILLQKVIDDQKTRGEDAEDFYSQEIAPRTMYSRFSK